MKYFILFIVMVAFVDTFSQLPIMSPFAKSIHNSPAFIGIVVGMYSFSNMFGNVLAGFWIDRKGAKRVLIFGLVITGCILILYPYASSPAQLLTIRFIHGLFGGFLVPAAFTAIANNGKKSRQGKSMAISGAAVGISAIIGPAFGAIITSRYSIDWVFLLISGTMITSAIFAIIFLPENETAQPRKKESEKTLMFSLLKNPMLAISYIGAFSLMFAQGTLAYMLPLQIEALDYDTVYSGILLSTFGITAILIFVLPINKIFDRYQHHYTMMSGMVIIGAALILLSSASSLPFLFFCMVLYGSGFALLFPSINALIVNNTNSETRGKAFGLFYAFFSLGVVIGSSFLGILAVSFKIGFIIGALILFANTLGMYFYFKQKSSINRSLG